MEKKVIGVYAPANEVIVANIATLVSILAAM